MSEPRVENSTDKGRPYNTMTAGLAPPVEDFRTALEVPLMVGELSDANNSGFDSEDTFAYHDKLQLPPAPKGSEWAYQPATHRWGLRPLTQAEIIVLDATVSGSTDEPPVFLDHWTQSTDTFMGLCLKYGITATQLRRANFGFSGTNLSLAPNPLRIPNISRAVPEEMDHEKIIQSLQLIFQGELTKSEVKCYLELNDWDVNRAIGNAKQDIREKDFSTDPSGERARFDTIIETVAIDEDF